MTTLTGYTREKWLRRHGPLMPVPDPEHPTEFQSKLWMKGPIEDAVVTGGPSTRIGALRKLCNAVEMPELMNRPDSSVWGNKPLLWIFQHTFTFHQQVIESLRSWVNTEPSAPPLDLTTLLSLLVLEGKLNGHVVTQLQKQLPRLPLTDEAKAYLLFFANHAKEVNSSPESGLSDASLLANNPQVEELCKLFELSDNATPLERCNQALLFYFFFSKVVFEGERMAKAAAKTDATVAAFFKSPCTPPEFVVKSNTEFEPGLPDTTEEETKQLVAMQQLLYTRFVKVYEAVRCLVELSKKSAPC